jgi:hypothetical protein
LPVAPLSRKSFCWGIGVTVNRAAGQTIRLASPSPVFIRIQQQNPASDESLAILVNWDFRSLTAVHREATETPGSKLPSILFIMAQKCGRLSTTIVRVE